VAVDERSPLGGSGIGFVGSATRTAIWADLPFREEPVAYRGYDQPDAAEVRTHRWSHGERHELTLRVALGDGDRHGYAPLLRALWSRQPDRSDPWVTIEEAAGLAADGLTTWHFHPEHRALYETAAFERNLDGSAGGEGDRPHMHVGWVSGAPWAAQLLRWGRRIGSEAHRRAGEDVLDHIAENLSPSGTFWAEWTHGRGWGTGWSPAGTIHANTIGQATLFFLRAMAAEDGHGARHPRWEAATRSNLDAIAARQRSDGNLGTYHHAATGEVAEWGGAGALVWIAALLDGADRYGDPAFRTAAERAGAYYRRFVDDELIFGAPEDVHLAPSSEDGYNAVIAYVALYRATGDAAWLDLATRAADWTLTFRYTYDVAFAPDTLLGAYRFRSRGTDQASPANQHLHHFGLLCTAEMVELSRATGDDHYRLRAAETLRAWRQFVSRRDGDFNARRGMVSERFYQTDCFRPKGSLLPLSHAWTGGVLLLACLDALEDPDALPA
ncbi:MAG: glycoside hydrolase family 127 protein, partial [Chloroflexota bacterium]|nr:glycoside hydrolase family 127 protein [Chloroflexota bacterium]